MEHGFTISLPSVGAHKLALVNFYIPYQLLLTTPGARGAVIKGKAFLKALAFGERATAKGNMRSHFQAKGVESKPVRGRIREFARANCSPYTT